MKYGLRAIRELITEAFDEDELALFCADYFREVTERFGSGMSKSRKVFELVAYYERREQLSILVEKVKAERPEKYKKYEAQLKAGEDAPSVLEEMRAEANQYAEVLEPLGSVEALRQRVSAEPDSTQASAHPLAGSPQEVKKWFLETLRPDEQVFVTTAALFSGLERQELMAVYQDVLGILRPVETQEEKEVSHG